MCVIVLTRGCMSLWSWLERREVKRVFPCVARAVKVSELFVTPSVCAIDGPTGPSVDGCSLSTGRAHYM